MNKRALSELYTPKQVRVLRRYFSTNQFRPYMLLNHGSVRSGKTTIDNEIFLQELLNISRYCNGKINHPQYILAGATVNNINRNVIREINSNYEFNIKLSQHNEFELFGVIVCCLGTADVGRFSAAVGMTSFGLYLNEASVADQSVFDELLKRCSGDKEFEPMIIADTNPDSPEHYFYTGYLNIPLEEKIRRRIVTFHWELDDNTFLNEQVKENIKNSTPSGVYYDRKIRGLWVSADGIVYQDFEKKVHVIPDDQVPRREQFQRFFVGVDWGYEHKGAMVLFGEMRPACKGDEPTLYILKTVAKQGMLADYWLDQAKTIIEQYGYGIKFYADDARPDLIEGLRRQGIWITGANKSVAAGVECVAGKWKRRKLFVAESASKPVLEEIFTYVWDEKKGLPVKEKDDVMDAIRYGVYTSECDARRVIR